MWSQSFRAAGQSVTPRRPFAQRGVSPSVAPYARSNSLYGVADQFEHANSLDRRFDHNLRKVVNTDRNFSS